MPHVPPFEVEAQLARHGGALRHLACELLGRGDAVDDAVQETWLRALQSPPRHAAGLGAWLATILRRVAFRARRGATRRRRREDTVAGARAVAADDHVAVLARAELGHRLLAAVEALEPPLRDVVWLRYFEGKAPREIAASSGVPIATVKSRLQRGLGILRERLGKDADGGDWRAGIAVAFGFGKEGAAGAAVASGGIVMATWTKVTAALAAAAAMAAIVWWLQAPDDVAPRTSSQSDAPRAATAGADADTSASTRDAVGAAAPVAPAAEAPVAGVARCRGRVIDAVTKAPLGGAIVTLRRSMGQAAEASDLVSTTRDDGTFVFEFTSEWTSPRLWFRAADHVEAWRDVGALDAGQDDDVGDAPLAVGRSPSGRVVDESGVPLPAGTRLRAWFGSAWSGPLNRRPYFELPLGVDGAFRCETALALGKVTFELDGGEHELKQEVVVTADSPAELTLVARRRAAIRGVAVDEAGAPLAGVSLTAGLGGPQVATSGDGAFTLLRPNGWAQPTTEIRVVHALEFRVSRTKSVPWGTNDLRIVLQRAPALTIEVVDDTGAPVEEFGVVLMREGTEGNERGAVLQRDVHGNGRLDVIGVDPGRTSLRIVPVDARLSPSAYVEIATTEPRRFVLAHRVPCTVEVSRAGSPAAGVRVRVLFADPDAKSDSWLHDPVEPHHGKRASMPPSPQPELAAERLTDANGVASLLRDADLERVVVVVGAERTEALVVRNPTFPVRVELPGAGTVAGRVQLRGRHRSQAGIAFHGSVNRNPLNLNATPQPDGTYRSPLLAAGTWRVTFAGLDASARDVVVRDGETAVVDFDFAEHPPAVFHGRLVRNGALPAGLTAELLRLVPGQSRPSPEGSTTVSADGTFAIGELQGGTYRLGLRAAGVSPVAMPSLFADTWVLAAGEQLRVDLPLPPRRLVVNLRRADGSAAKNVRVLTRCDGVQWPSHVLLTQPIDDVMVLDPAPLLPVELALAANKAPVWSTPVVMPLDRSEYEVTVVLPE